MDENLKPVILEFEKDFGVQASEFRGEASLMIPADKIVAACQKAHDLGFELLSALTAVDYWPEQQPRFHVIYEFGSVSKNLRLEIRVPVPGINPTVPTVSHLYR